MEQAFPTKKTYASGIGLRYVDVSGPGPALIFLRGATDALDGYRTVLTLLTGTHRLVALDLRGHGGSAHVAGAYRIADHVADVRALLAELAVPAVLAGHSLGALVAIGVAAASPLVRGVFLEDPPFFASRPEAIRATPDYQIFAGLRMMLAQHHAQDGGLNALAAVVGSWPVHPALYEGRSLHDVAGPAAVAARADALHRLDLGVLDAILDGTQHAGIDLDAALAAISVPVHLLAGDVACGGTIDDVDIARLPQPRGPFTCRRLAGVGHFIHHTDPATYVDELRAFVARCG